MGKNSRQCEKKKRSNGFLRGKKKKRKMTAHEMAVKSKELATEMKKQCYKCEEMLDKTMYGYKQWIAANPKDRKCSRCVLPPDSGTSGGYLVECVNMQENVNDYDWDNDVYIEEPGYIDCTEKDNIHSLSEQVIDWIQRTF